MVSGFFLSKISFAHTRTLAILFPVFCILCAQPGIVLITMFLFSSANIENTGNKIAKVLVWANEILDKKNPDTIFYKV